MTVRRDDSGVVTSLRPTPSAVCSPLLSFRMPEVGLEPTRPCGQRILSAPKDRSRVTVGWQLAVFLGNDGWR